jgi:hypothetical protein
VRPIDHGDMIQADNTSLIHDRLTLDNLNDRMNDMSVAATDMVKSAKTLAVRPRPLYASFYSCVELT